MKKKEAAVSSNPFNEQGSRRPPTRIKMGWRMASTRKFDFL